MAPSDASDAAYLASLLRERDRARYFAALFAPPGLRRDLFALYGFAAELERVPELVSDPAVGEIRLQWWREAVATLADGMMGGGGHPALRELGLAVARHGLPHGPLAALVEARSRALYADPPTSVADLEGYLGETESALFQLACLAAGSSGRDTADASGHAGVAFGLARHLSRFAQDRAQSRTILPLDLLAAEGLSAADVFAAGSAGALAKVVAKLIARAREHLRTCIAKVAALPRPFRPVFLPLVTTAPLLMTCENLDRRIISETTALPDLESLLRIGFARFRDWPSA